jgi:hypothetical protein
MRVHVERSIQPNMVRSHLLLAATYRIGHNGTDPACDGYSPAAKEY